jgi:lysozyme
MSKNERDESDAPTTEPDGSTDPIDGSNTEPDPPDDDTPEGEPPDETEGAPPPTDVAEATPPPLDDDEGVGGAGGPSQPAGLSDRGAAFIARFEGCILHLYNDPVGHCTIGIGHLVHLGNCDGREPADFKHGINRARAFQLLEQDARQVVQAIHRFVRVPLKQHQFDALCSFGFNVGVGAIRSSGVTRTLNAGNFGGVPAKLMQWVNAGGHPVSGLVRRRRAEGELFAHGNYDA